MLLHGKIPQPPFTCYHMPFVPLFYSPSTPRFSFATFLYAQVFLLVPAVLRCVRLEKFTRVECQDLGQ